MVRNRHWMWIGAVGALALLGQVAVHAQEAKQDAAKPVALKPTVKAGDTVRYKGTIEVSAGGNDVKVVQTEKHTVKEAKDNGEIIVLIEDEGGKVDFGGMENDIPASPEVTVTLDKRNTMRSYKPKTEDASFFSVSTQHLLSMAERVIFPEKEVKPDDSWKTEIDNPAVKGKKVNIKTTFVGMDKVEGKPAWKVKQTLEADTEGEGKMTIEMTALLDPANGQTIESEHTAKGVPSQMGPLEWKGKSQRLKAEEKKASAL